jgi:signal recognition particle subunit SEC65
MINSEKLADHPFFQFNLPYILPLVNKSIDEMQKIGNDLGIRSIEQSNRKLDSSLFYHYTVFLKLMTLVEAIERLQYSITFIKEFPHPKKYMKEGITQYIWWEYHYSNFVLTYNSLLDLSLILVNAIFEIGYEEKDCKYSKIFNSSEITTGVRESIAKVKKIVGGYISQRNYFVHRGQFPDMKSINQDYFFDLLKLANMHPEVFPAGVLKANNTRASRSIIPPLNNEVEKAQITIFDLFDTLYPVYQAKTQELGSNNVSNV